MRFDCRVSQKRYLNFLSPRDFRFYESSFHIRPGRRIIIFDPIIKRVQYFPKIYSHFKTTDPIIKVSGSDFKQIAVFNYYIILTASLLILGNIVNLLIWVPILHLSKSNINTQFEIILLKWKTLTVTLKSVFNSSIILKVRWLFEKFNRKQEIRRFARINLGSTATCF